MHDPVEPTTYIAHVPSFIFTSDSYKTVFPRKVATLRGHINSRIHGDDTFNTLPDMAGIRFPEQDISKSFASEDFIDTTRWILGSNDVHYRYKDL